MAPMIRLTWQVLRCAACTRLTIGHGAGERCPGCFGMLRLLAGGAFFSEADAMIYAQGASR